MALGNRVRELREARGETLRELAAIVAMDFANLSKVERGERGCADEAKLALAQHFDVRVDEIFFQPDVVLETTELDTTEAPAS